MASTMSSILLFVLFSLLSSSALAAQKSYIVYLGGHSHGRDASPLEHQRATDSHYEFLASFVGSKEKAMNAIYYSYNKHINGFAAVLDEEEAVRIANHQEVVSVIPDKLNKLHTTRSWQFLNLEKDNYFVPPKSAWRESNFGQDVIIGNLDTGVWPESESFADQGLGPVPAKWKGSCTDNTKEGVPCNKKLIGAKYFNKGYLANETYYSTRDLEGHGTHTLSTAGGSFVKDASIFGYANGTAKGGSPYARVAAYKVCGETGCFDSNIMAATDEAIHDGVDVLSVSLGGSASYYHYDGLAISSFHAVKEGIVFVASAGNDGPYPYTVSNVAPWIFTIGASTVDRDFVAEVVLDDINDKTNQSSIRLRGESVADKRLPEKSFPLIRASDAPNGNTTSTNADYCDVGSLDPKKVKGKIVVCKRGQGVSRVVKGIAVGQAGGVGMILVNEKSNGDEVLADPHFIPASHLTYSQGLKVYDYINKTKSPVSALTGFRTLLHAKPAPMMASFSSRGPNPISPEILKPDVIAPGVNILAAYPTNLSPSIMEVVDQRRVSFITMSGTSMSCPHVSGIVGLVKAVHPSWSPAAIKSAIMTTAINKDNTGNQIKNNYTAEATPFQRGAGHVRPNRAVDPGLVYDITPEEYLDFLCNSGTTTADVIGATFANAPFKCPSKLGRTENLNYPSITLLNLTSTRTVLRKVKNVGEPGKYTVRVKNPAGIVVSVKPRHLRFNRVGEEKSFEVKFTPTKGYNGKDAFGELVWSDGKHNVRSPLVVFSPSPAFA